MIKAVIFDLDGTLVNSLSDLADSTNYALKQFGFPPHKLQEFKMLVGDGMPKLIERALPPDNRDEDTKSQALKTFLEYYKEHYADKTTAYNGIDELLGELKTKGLKIAVVSNKADQMTGVVVNKLFGDIFDCVTGKREGYPTKPDPTLTLEIIEKLGANPAECLFVGDSGMDMATAVNSGCVAVGVLWGFRGEDELLKNGAQYIIKNPIEVIDILKEN